MIVALLSNDYRLYDLCSSILAEKNLDSRPLLLAAEPEAPLPHADLYIWDFVPDVRIARCLAACDPHRHIVLVERGGYSGSELRGLKLVLKPVTKVALAAWLIPALDGLEESEKPTDGQNKTISSLLEANIRLQEYELDRNSFLAKITHDFRAPLTAMSGYCGLMLAGALGPLTDVQREVLGRTQNSLKRLARMSSSLLQLTSDPAAGSAPNLEEGDLNECVQQAIHEVQPLIGEKRVEVTAHLEPASLYFDTGQLERVFTNLIENACKFTSSGGRIEIRGYPYFWERRITRPRGLVVAERRVGTDKTPNAYRVDVCNTGPAIDPEHLSCIFDEYTSYGDKSGGANGGSGLGLAICKSIVQEHRGQIWAENHAEGPAFSFVLPLDLEFITTMSYEKMEAGQIG